jgi:ABC-type polysaccharide/polyol phosphate transport system ATPase subunit
MSDSDTVISVESLSKRYLVGHEGPQERYHSLRDTIVRHGKNYVRKAIDMARGRQIIQGDTVEEFWALKDVSFEVKQGEVLGIIGSNGAGKSTLLKILSRITEPTSGRVTLKGRVASLLEVGTGFHPELTGRENIFLNAAILGMKRAEVQAKFDEIVDFAGVEKFLDTPVKRYSSGMYVRLAFAVAAHLDPEILIIDEVLAVGDAEFQKKCLGKMEDVAKGGRTVLFVSHNMAAVKALTQKAILLYGGKVECSDIVEVVIERYLTGGKDVNYDGIITAALPRQFSTNEAWVRRVYLENDRGESVRSIVTGEILKLRIEWEVTRPLMSAMIEIGLMNSDGRQITQSLSTKSWGAGVPMETGLHRTGVHIDQIIFPGRYSILVGIHKTDGTTVDFIERALDFEVINAGKGEPNYYEWSVRGYLQPNEKWLSPSLLNRGTERSGVIS